LYPVTVDVVLAVQERATLCCGAAVPEPLTDSTIEVLVALLAKLMFADAVPDACGVNVTVKDAVPPAAIVSGKDIPLTENSEPLTPADDTVTGAPLAESVAV
jgi:hypothetical protein